MPKAGAGDPTQNVAKAIKDQILITSSYPSEHAFVAGSQEVDIMARMGDQSMTNPDFDRLQTELEAFELMTAGFVGSIVRAAGLIPDDRWNWSFSERTPTAREICEHTFAWLWCDCQQVTVLDRSKHRPTPDLPADRSTMIRLLQGEAKEWRILVRSLTPEQLLEERQTFDGDMRLVRSFLFHMGQQVVYKAGQIWMLAFDLGLDGSGPYDAPYPNRDYGFVDAAPWPSPRG